MTMLLSYAPKTEAEFRGRRCVIVRTVSPSEVLVRFKDGGDDTEVARVTDLQAPADPNAPPIRPIDALHPDDLAEAKRRLEIIRPVLECRRGRMQLVKVLAEQHGIGASTIRRWVKDYEDRGLLSDLAPRRKGRAMPKGLDAKVEEIIQAVIQDFYLTKQQRSQRKTIEEVIRRCRARGLTPPHKSTIRSRLKAVDERERVEKRQGRKAARDRFAPVRGNFPGADWPLAVVQIDHTKLDIELVDDDSRQPIGRPWLTLAIDVFSRMITGFYISLDHPGAAAVGMCVAQSILQKDAELQHLGVNGDWPVWGKPQTIHADNGKDFRSLTLAKACEQYGINIDWRPVKVPHYGGHIERLMGTVAKEIHSLPGTTFSNIRQKGEYDSAKEAVLTQDELTRLFAEFVVNEYHKKVHRGIGMSPMEKWWEGINGDDRKRKGTGLTPPIADPRRLYLDFLPFVERSVQTEGIVWDHIHYYCETIRPWISARRGGVTEKFTIRRDPRDISCLYFFDPQIKDYIEVPYRDADLPSVTLWEYRAARKQLASQGQSDATVDEVFACIERRRQIVDEAAEKTRRMRRERQRRKATEDQLARRPIAEPVPKAPPKATRKGSVKLVVDNSAPASAPLSEEFDIPDDVISRGAEEW